MQKDPEKPPFKRSQIFYFTTITFQEKAEFLLSSQIWAPSAHLTGKNTFRQKKERQ